jgi:hypothetical protein
MANLPAIQIRILQNIRTIQDAGFRIEDAGYKI